MGGFERGFGIGGFECSFGIGGLERDFGIGGFERGFGIGGFERGFGIGGFGRFLGIGGLEYCSETCGSDGCKSGKSSTTSAENLLETGIEKPCESDKSASLTPETREAGTVETKQ